MAQKTSVVATFQDGAVRAEVDWNDANGGMTKFRVVNATDQPAYMYAVMDPPIGGYSTVGVTALANQTSENVLPNNTAKFTRATDPDTGQQYWDLVGISIFCRYPA